MLTPLKRRFEWISELGVAALPPEDQHRVRFANRAAVAAIVPTILYAALYLATEPRRLFLLWAVNLLAAAIYFAGLALTAWRRHAAARVLVALTVIVHISAASLLTGPASGFQYYFFLIVPGIALLFPLLERPAYVLLAVASVATFVYIDLFQTRALIDVGALRPLLKPSAIFFVFVSITMLLAQFQNDNLRAHQRSEKLLLNILPASVSERLKAGDESIADGFGDVTVLFADIVGFTALAAELPPAELVALLNRVFSEFDELTARHGLEKIKTIGDAYMVAAGLPEPRPDHARKVAEMALEMRAALERISADSGHPLDVRIGIHTGPVVAGVIGRRKFAYDLWGDTVNTASRMESHGAAGKIQITQAVREKLGAAFEVVPRGSIHVKGKGEMETFWLEAAVAR